jgi:hypothetical protein
MALQEWTRDRVPLDWAMAQMNLGNALLTSVGTESCCASETSKSAAGSCAGAICAHFGYSFTRFTGQVSYVGHDPAL